MSPGQELRAAREAMGLSLDEVAERTKIPPRYLDALERDDHSVFPSGPFLAGFSKKYRVLLALPERAAAGPQVVSPVHEPTSTVTSPARPSSATRKRALRSAAIGGAVAVVVLVVINAVGGAGPVEEGPVGEPTDLAVQVDVEEAVRARVYVDGERKFAESLKPGPGLQFNARDELRVELETLDGVEVTFQGKPLKPLGHQSRPRRLVFVDDGG
jgi:transcriptional regulator with XRE-family HTH domain